MKNIQIIPFQTAFEQDIIDLVLTIQQSEFLIEITIEDQPDLKQIAGFYQKGKGNFWVAKYNNELAGTIGLLDIGNGNGALRKMFVKKEFRGKEWGVGQQLLQTVFDWAAQLGFTKILLGTTDKFLAAQRFYEKNNFTTISINQLPPEFHVMKVDTKFYEYSIK
jgi:GNAT superfamily N-acetyltransferase